MAAFEAILVIRIPFKGQQINDVNSLITSLAFIQRSCEGHYEVITLLLKDRLDPRRENLRRRNKNHPQKPRKTRAIKTPSRPKPRLADIKSNANERMASKDQLRKQIYIPDDDGFGAVNPNGAESFESVVGSASIPDKMA